MKIISLRNNKGGVGKTTATGSVGAGLAQDGKRVLIIDADPQGNLSGWLAPKEATHTLKDVVENKCSLQSAIYNVRENLFILPTAENEDLREIENSYLARDQRFFMRKQVKINEDLVAGFFGQLIEMNFDYVLIDFAPTWSAMERALAHILDEVFVILEPEAFSVRGYRQQIENIKELELIADKEIVCNKLIISKINNSFNIHKEAAAVLEKNYNCFYIRQDSEIKKMQTQGKTPFDIEFNNSKSYEDFKILLGIV